MDEVKSANAVTGLDFCKMQGAGNDFILINGARYRRLDDPGALAVKLCARRVSVGADGLVIVEPEDDQPETIRVRFWNPDGGEAATCGNGTRCAARYALLEGLAPERMVIETKGGVIDATVHGRTVTLGFRRTPTLELEVTASGAGGPLVGHRAVIGDPHFVIPVAALPEGEIDSLCRPLRNAPELAPEGANIHLVQTLDRHNLRIRTYERGVEAETLACGSGSMSSVLALSAAGHLDSPVRVETRSGDALTVRFQRDADGGFSRPELEGPARIVYWGNLSLDRGDLL